eukprot:3606570-Rhodomonas_salina.1
MCSFVWDCQGCKGGVRTTVRGQQSSCHGGPAACATSASARQVGRRFLRALPLVLGIVPGSCE